jgi:hypothetical protein
MDIIIYIKRYFKVRLFQIYKQNLELESKLDKKNSLGDQWQKRIIVEKEKATVFNICPQNKYSNQ